MINRSASMQSINIIKLPNIYNNINQVINVSPEVSSYDDSEPDEVGNKEKKNGILKKKLKTPLIKKVNKNLLANFDFRHKPIYDQYVNPDNIYNTNLKKVEDQLEAIN